MTGMTVMTVIGSRSQLELHLFHPPAVAQPSAGVVLAAWTATVRAAQRAGSWAELGRWISMGSFGATFIAH